ncbi:hypothetical protein [Natrinema altunense]|uniref:hypothetical protein n=1 Tax=Natrinema altunense TaxID=222984 RepID=UPI0011849FFC|nr:hypothetical protein [Natrinema altunense]
MFGKETEGTLNRRRLLKNMGAVGSTIVIGSTSTAAQLRAPPENENTAELRKQNAHRVLQEFDTTSAVANTIENRAAELLDELVAEGYADRQFIQRLEKKAVTDFLDADEGLFMSPVPRGTHGFEADIIAKTTLSDEVLEVHVQPRSDNAYAILTSNSDTHSQILTTESSGGGLSAAADCIREWYCIENWDCSGPGGCNIGSCHVPRKIHWCPDWDGCTWGAVGDDCCRSTENPPCRQDIGDP